MAFTFFFRDGMVLDAAAEILVRETMGRSRVRVWNAGCAMGPETFSFLMMLSERMGKFAFETVTVDATDYEEHGDFGSVVRAGRYPFDMLSRIPRELFERYFDAASDETGHYDVSDRLKRRVRFIHHDLLDGSTPGYGYAMVICKNVLLHFNERQRLEVLGTFHDSLDERGVLVMEHTQKLPTELDDRFEKVLPDLQIFRKRSAVVAQV